MASKALVLLLAILATSLLMISQLVPAADARELAENTAHTDTEDKNDKTLTDSKYGGGFWGYPGYGGGGYGGYPGYGGGGYGGYPGYGGGYGGYPGYGGGGYGGYPGYGGRGGYCRFGCCRRGFYGGCQCCLSAHEVPEQAYRPEVHN